MCSWIAAGQGMQPPVRISGVSPYTFRRRPLPPGMEDTGLMRRGASRMAMSRIAMSRSASRIAMGLAAGSFVAALLTSCAWTTTPVTLDARPPAQTSWVTAADGTVITSLHADEDREVVMLGSMPKVLVDAVVAVEDARYWQHTGVDLKAVLRAVRANATEGRVVEGGSTITQQYVKNTLVGNSRDAHRKLAEARAAWELERHYTKERILELYLNSIYFGNGAYGVQAAARQYYGVTVDQLTLPQAAVLAGVIHAPLATDPFLHPDVALARRREVLTQMVATGSIGPAEADAAAAQPLGLRVRPLEERYAAPYFVEQVKRFILDDPDHTGKFGATPEARRDLLFRGGLRITTTVDLARQAEAEDAVAKVLTDPDHQPSAALVSIEPKTGYVRALVGGRDFFGTTPQAKFDLAVQGRRPAGSSFKPFVLAAALEAGIPLDTQWDAPSHIDIPLPEPSHEIWHVDNAENEATGRINLIEATVHSVNTVYAQLIMQLGPAKGVAMAARLGIESPLQPIPSAVLGTNDVSPLEMADAYATLANDGIRVPPTFVTKVAKTDGTVLYQEQHQQARVLDPVLTSIETAVLQQVIARGTGRAAALDRPVAGKTGTGEEWRDAWFVGYTPDMATSVWVGFPEAQRSMVPPLTPIKVFGGTWPADIWHRYMAAALAGQPPTPFPVPPSVQPGTAATTTTLPPGALVLVPVVVGLSEAGAKVLLAAAGMGFVHQDVPDDIAPAGTVVRQTPAGGTPSPPGTSVLLLVSSGRS
ncbi:MAG: penicillin-binding protein, partial [Acidimicrobiaceae bacterium]|nr:penicillin-binding protein [Acidimicrobiaceae bacterium]